MTLPNDLTLLTASESRSALDNKEISAVELTHAYLQRIEQVEPKLHSYLHMMTDVALAQANDADARIENGEAQDMTGIPVALKDIISTTDAPTTAGSKMLEGYISPFDAHVVTRLRKQGAVILGKTNTDEFAMGSSTETSVYGKTVNPWGKNRVPGGSSGGSAVAVAAREAAVSLGSDTGGSIRQPASFCGVVGLKPTYGRVSRSGVIPFASSLDQVGTFSRTVEDTTMLLRAIAGRDPKDSTSSPINVTSFAGGFRDDLKGVKVGIVLEFGADGMEPGVESKVTAAYQQLEALGAELVEISLPHAKYALPAYYTLAPAEASANLARYDGIRFGNRIDGDDLVDTYMRTRGQGFGPEVRRRILLGTYMLSEGQYDTYFLKAQKVRTLVNQDFIAAFELVDVIASPTSATVAFELGERSGDPAEMALSDSFTIPANMAGIPGISVPCGFSDGLPVGLQLMGNSFEEETLLGIAYAYEQAANVYQEMAKV